MLDLVVESTQNLTDRVRLFTLRDAAHITLPRFTPGAHLEFALNSGMTRSYSIIDFSSVTPPQHYQIAVQLEPDGQGGSQHMHTLSAGDRVHCTEPRNTFELDSSNEPAILLAGGIGVTPLISMAKALENRGTPFHFHYSGRTRAAMAFHDQLDSQHHNNMTFYYDDIPQSKLDIKRLLENSNASEQRLYICGPKGMIDSARSIAETAGIQADNIHVELFTSPNTTTNTNSFEIELKHSGQVLVIPADRTIIDVLQEAGIDVTYDCQRGDCGICQTEVLAGEIDHRDVVLSDAERKSGNVMQICVSRAKSARLVLDL